jgi:hypothetical protein
VHFFSGWLQLMLTTLSAEAIRVVVMDGVTLGHPRCTVKNCMKPLSSTKHRYCSEHKQKSLECVVDGCVALASDGKLTCADAEHRMYKNVRNLEHKSMHSMRRRQEGLRVPGLVTASQDPSDEQNKHVQGLLDRFSYQCDGKTDRCKKPTVLFARNWTNNEQILVTPCGIIVGIATMHASESLDSTRVRPFVLHR